MVIIPDIIPQNQPWPHPAWNYGPNNLYPSGEGHVPSRLTFEATTTEGLWYKAYNLNLRVHYQVTVVKSCTVANINEDICVESCINNVNSCTATYSAYCLDPSNPARIAEPVCFDYYSKYIKVNASDPLIDQQAGRYCLSKYKGLADLANSNNPRDIDICSCNLPANSSDTTATVLYNNYFNDLETKVPALKQFGSQPKCLYPACAAASFRPTVIPLGGCQVPQCISGVVINNDGTINGNVVVTPDTECNQYNPNIPQDSGFLTIIFVLIIIVVIIAVVLYFSHYGPKYGYVIQKQQRLPATTSQRTYVPQY
jgi:hypothetical protein